MVVLFVCFIFWIVILTNLRRLISIFLVVILNLFIRVK